MTVCLEQHHHIVLRQPDETTCGNHCCAMVKVITGGSDAVPAGPASKDDELFAMVKAQGIKAQLHKRRTPSQMKDLVRKVTPTKPIIAAVIWEGEDRGHWIVIAGRTTHFNQSSEYCILDPAYGLHTTSLSAGSLPLKFTAGLRNYPGLLYTVQGHAALLKGTLITIG